MMTRPDRDTLLLAVFTLLIALFTLFCLLPFVLVVISSFTDEVVLLQDGYRFFPRKLSLNAYRVALKTDTVVNGYLITTFVTVAGTLLSLVVTAAAAYAISGTMLKHRNKIAFYFYFTMLFSGGLVPSYILISKYLQLRNNIWVYILPILVNPWNLFLLRNFFNMIPKSLSESAYMDGANELLIFRRIILPLSLPSLATIGLFYSLTYWNIWMESMLYVDNQRLHTLQYIIMRIIRNITASKNIAAESGIVLPTPPAYTLRLATALLTIGPVILFYPFLQKYFVRGLIVGGIKG